jgi:AmiR/NasT family two-component response regulator
VIDQAKGIVMARAGCSADDAFRRMVKMSNDSNVRVAEVASALVYHVENGGRRTAANP